MMAASHHRRSRCHPFFLVLIASLLSAAAFAEDIKIASTRVWPAQDYTRVTIESATPIQSQLLLLNNPDRLVLDLANVALTPALQALATQIGSDDPYVKAVRVGRFKPGVVRLVFDLKTEVKPQIFSLKPVAEYDHRLVLDIYPTHPADPLLALLLSAPTEGPATAVSPATEPAEAAVAASPLPVPTEPEPLAKPEGTGAKSANRRLIIVAIDPGHGGEDPGAHGRRGTYEKNVTLAIARKLKAMMDQEPNLRGVLTRDGDYFVPLYQRVVKARKVDADLFVSIHADAYGNPNASGSSVFALSEHGATSSAAKWLAKKENEADLIGGVNLDVPDPYLKMTLTDLSFTAQVSDSLKLGRAVLSELGEINNLHRGMVEQAGFAVLKAPDIPSILVETAFISNPDEERKLRDDAYQNQIASAILAGIKRYFSQNPPLARGPFAANP
jgi:N-acetylmuramoyl-L-alanine amidase